MLYFYNSARVIVAGANTIFLVKLWSDMNLIDELLPFWFYEDCCMIGCFISTYKVLIIYFQHLHNHNTKSCVFVCSWCGSRPPPTP